jgi:hypothetical protein
MYSQASLNCRVDFRIWHRSQSKKKRRKRILVATACHSLGELLKRHASEPSEFSRQFGCLNFHLVKKGVEVRLVCEATHRRRGASRGKPHNGAVLIVAVRPPASSHLFRPPQSEDGSSLSDALCPYIIALYDTYLTTT